jgi:hypothetical protein
LGTLTPLWRTSLIYYQGTAHKRASIAGLNSLGRHCIIIDLDKAESARLATKTVAQDIHAVDVNSGF